MPVYLKLSLIAVLSLAMLSGCQQSEPEVVAAKGSPAPQSPQVAVPLRLPTANDESSTPEASSLLQAMANYESPFPNRHEMFVPPKAGPAPRASSNNEGNVQLRGFVDVDEPRAILDIEGATTLLAVGGEKYGVKVIAIDEMNVTLERGQTRWTATLE
ncbi:MAG: hypothetical protein ACR2NU_08130 [Aeoliella sp.]